ncbi:acyl-CoA dehydrogenase [Tsukamurella sp. 8F]|uniref:acyl-CoA dehydrogenase n=1 Tax=unclassified Tsukamurella TaxID=2633480 RepID=UPI0023B97106|nr:MULTISPECIES: acyl-CoA dehydrogenase [unclassified Tsukamurella]MDF0531653.1 acyl-CoA dehydrogenase [Tsukamurella sp. 8J]MDF0588779.1 acyl-CoA dehydrogenase [Tsukamurella sp. 8F]
MKQNVQSPYPLLDARDIDFLLYDWLQVEKLCERPEFAEHSRETLDAALDLAADIAAKKLANHYKLADQHEPTVAADGTATTLPETAEGLRAIFESGLVFGELPTDGGGIGLPATVAKAAWAWMHAANVPTAVYAGLTLGNANVIRSFGSEEQQRTFVGPMTEGRFTGTMCLSEPEAGSSLSDITTRAVPRPDGSYGITGNKMWITGGDHEMTENIVHLVLAKLPDAPEGVKGISLFVVPKYLVQEDGSIGARNDVALVSLNHKMGNKGTTNCLLALGDGAFPQEEGGATGYLIGAENRGLIQMFQMMNEARIAVGLAASSIAYTAHLQSVEYARTRVQGRLISDPTGPQVPLVQHPDVRRMLLAQKAYAQGGLALVLFCSSLVDEARSAPDEADREAAGQLLDLLTPITKSWPAEWGTVACDLAIQIHGGYGYTRDYNVEQLYRDNRLNAIHEGAKAIHGLDLLGRKVPAKGGATFGALLGRFEATAQRADTGDRELAEAAADLRRAASRIVEVTTTLGGAGDPALSMANATAYLDGVGQVVLAWLWLDQALATAGDDSAFARGKRITARYFFVYELPKAHTHFDLLARLDRTTLELDTDVL